MKKTRELTPIQQRAITLLLQGKSQTEIARELNIDRTTLWNWRTKDPVFTAELNKAQAELYAQAVSRLYSLTTKALETLEEILEKSDDEQTKIKAASFILKSAGLNEINFTPGPMSEEEVIEHWVREEAEKEDRREREEFYISFQKARERVLKNLAK